MTLVIYHDGSNVLYCRRRLDRAKAGNAAAFGVMADSVSASMIPSWLVRHPSEREMVDRVQGNSRLRGTGFASEQVPGRVSGGRFVNVT